MGILKGVEVHVAQGSSSKRRTGSGFSVAVLWHTLWNAPYSGQMAMSCFGRAAAAVVQQSDALATAGSALGPPTSFPNQKPQAKA